MTREQLESLGLTDERLVARLGRLLGHELEPLVGDNSPNDRVRRRRTFDRVMELEMTTAAPPAPQRIGAFAEDAPEMHAKSRSK